MNFSVSHLGAAVSVI